MVLLVGSMLEYGRKDLGTEPGTSEVLIEQKLSCHCHRHPHFTVREMRSRQAKLVLIL